jgi:hypothetical protein
LALFPVKKVIAIRGAMARPDAQAEPRRPGCVLAGQALNAVLGTSLRRRFALTFSLTFLLRGRYHGAHFQSEHLGQKEFIS